MGTTHAPLVGPLRDWLRGQTAVTNLTGADGSTEGIYANGAPDSAPAACLVIRKAGRGAEETAVNTHLVQIDCWAATGAAAEALAVAVENTLRNAVPSTQLTGGPRFSFVETVSDLWVPDPGDDTPRQVLTVLLSATAASA